MGVGRESSGIDSTLEHPGERGIFYQTKLEFTHPGKKRNQLTDSWLW